ncbi:MAG: hypothetical protein ACI379_06155 [Nocardioides sp.]|uniref:hypothetical protein n=1 Tax=Nocardioides sp. TaxID=35761 RepID=UPI003F110EE4
MRLVVGLLLGLSGSLMIAASAQRWAAPCPWGEPTSTPQCELRQDHRYDFLLPSDPWQPLGGAAQLAGWSLLVLAVAYLVLPWTLLRGGAGRLATAAGIVLAAATTDVGAATLRSGLAGSPVDPVSGIAAVWIWALVAPAFLILLALPSALPDGTLDTRRPRGLARAALVPLALATPIVAAFTYAVGSYDARPWWEAYNGALTATAGLCLLAAAAASHARWTHAPARTPATWAGRCSSWWLPSGSKDLVCPEDPR